MMFCFLQDEMRAVVLVTTLGEKRILKSYPKFLANYKV